MTRASAFILGYHGCDRKIEERVLEGKQHLRASKNDYDWLGAGIYFWENSADRAGEWAKLAKENPKLARSQITEPFVVGAIIDLGNCLDLLEAESIQIVERSYEMLKVNFETANLIPPENKGAIRRLDCATINHAHALRSEQREPEFDTVRAAFFEGEPLYQNAGFQKRTHVQICVRTPKQILGYFRPIGMLDA